MIIALLCLIAAFVVGFAAHRGGTCGVVAMTQWLDRRDARLIIGFATAMAAATVICLPAAWLLGVGDHLPGSTPVGPALIGGGVLLGIGAFVNGACLIGSLWRLGNGEAHLVALPLGVAIGDALGAGLGWRVVPPPGPFAEPGSAGLMLVTAGGLMLAATAIWLMSRPGGTRLFGLMTAMGLAGGLLFVALPGWTWVDVERETLDGLIAGMARPPGQAGLAMIATLGGALTSGWLTGRLRLCWNGWEATGRSIIGGALMMMGARLLPGGNDALLLGAAPAGAASALIGFAVMNLAVLGCAAIVRIRRAGRPARS
ncbi:YeeE/YedE thiosulfate transporter family protein [Sphingomonas changnyeongensis]|uniref:YeeE/YedE thiosulfate transporter family protein n=1 Tax=Sphingomonas changnyeongensis TaxID=2698679 RepID=UPI001E3C63C7|nr:YeeE/YedE thiosulfate transporter family protein [Sphingomonas changnyeongensis]